MTEKTLPTIACLALLLSAYGTQDQNLPPDASNEIRESKAPNHQPLSETIATDKLQNSPQDVSVPADDFSPGIRLFNERGELALHLGAGRQSEEWHGLVQCLEDKGGKVRASAARALGCIKAKQAVPNLKAALHDGDPAVRTAAAEALAEIEAPRTKQ